MCEDTSDPARYETYATLFLLSNFHDRNLSAVKEFPAHTDIVWRRPYLISRREPCFSYFYQSFIIPLQKPPLNI